MRTFNFCSHSDFQMHTTELWGVFLWVFFLLFLMEGLGTEPGTRNSKHRLSR